jgi:hypothetical protein
VSRVCSQSATGSRRTICTCPPRARTICTCPPRARTSGGEVGTPVCHF